MFHLEHMEPATLPPKILSFDKTNWALQKDLT